MLQELFNLTTGAAGIVKVFGTDPDFARYHDKTYNYTATPLLPPKYEDKDNIGGHIVDKLKYMSEKVK